MAAPSPKRAMRRRPELTLFTKDGDGRFLLRPMALNSYQWATASAASAASATSAASAASAASVASAATAASAASAAAAPDAEYLQQLRGKLSLRTLRDYGYDALVEDISDAALAVAVMGGLVSNPAFLDIIDDLLIRESCLCCYYTMRRSQAVDAEKQIRIVLQYYSQDAYENSNSFYRLLCGLLRDIYTGEGRAIVSHQTNGPMDAGASSSSAVKTAIAALNKVTDVYAISTAHANPSQLYGATHGTGWSEPGLLGAAGIAICIYSTAGGRKVLRRMGKLCQKANLTLATRVATSSGYEFFCLRYKYRARVLEVYSADNKAGLPEFWSCVKKIGKAPRRVGGDHQPT